jgi:hypothetical protein
MAVPQFFVPAATAETRESIYESLAAFAKQPVPELQQRVFSITYNHDGETWTSTVGEPSVGMRRLTVDQGSSKRETVTHLSDPAITLAIFPGNPYVVVTNEGLGGRSVGSAWVNPFYMGAGSISSVLRFSM